jgi:hypothetical protein
MVWFTCHVDLQRREVGHRVVLLEGGRDHVDMAGLVCDVGEKKQIADRFARISRLENKSKRSHGELVCESGTTGNVIKKKYLLLILAG